MALTTCPDCGSPVSPRAPACPHCGAGIRPVRVERTGKWWKIQQLAGLALLAPGIGSAAMEPSYPVPAVWEIMAGDAARPMMLIGAVTTLAGLFGAWWCHG